MKHPIDAYRPGALPIFFAFLNGSSTGRVNQGDDATKPILPGLFHPYHDLLYHSCTSIRVSTKTELH